MPPVAPPCPPMPSVELPCPVNNEMCIAVMYMADLEKKTFLLQDQCLSPNQFMRVKQLNLSKNHPNY